MPQQVGGIGVDAVGAGDRKSTRLNSSHGYISYAVFCLKKKNEKDTTTPASSLLPSTSSLTPLPLSVPPAPPFSLTSRPSPPLPSLRYLPSHPPFRPASL